MSLKDQLIKLGYEAPELRDDLRPVLSALDMGQMDYSPSDSMEQVREYIQAADGVVQQIFNDGWWQPTIMEEGRSNSTTWRFYPKDTQLQQATRGDMRNDDLPELTILGTGPRDAYMSVEVKIDGRKVYESDDFDRPKSGSSAARYFARILQRPIEKAHKFIHEWTEDYINDWYGGVGDRRSYVIPEYEESRTASNWYEREKTSAHHQEGGDWYADTKFLNQISRVYPGSTLKSMGFGEFYLETPDGRLDFDRMRGKDFPGMSGRSHKMYDDAGGKVVEKAIRLMERNASTKQAALDEGRVEELRQDLSRWLKRRSDSRHTMEAELGYNGDSLQGDFRTWDIEKEMEYQDRRNIDRVVSKAKSDLERALSGYSDIIESISASVGDKNYVEVWVNLKS